MDGGDDAVPETQQHEDHPLLHRRKSSSAYKLTLLPHQNSSSASSTTTTAATSSFSSFPSEDLELLSIKPTSRSYTSLKDLLPTVAVNSPKPNSVHQAQPGSDICIRNRLVKQAAWAYLQPMSTSPGSAGDNFFHRLWPRVAAFFDFVRRSVFHAAGWMLRVFSIRCSR